MLTGLKLYATCLITIAALDFIWIGVLMNTFYFEQLKSIGREAGGKLKPILWAVGAVYLILPLELFFSRSRKSPLIRPGFFTFGIGALLGFIIYGTYDFTNYATLKGFTLVMTIVDISWGTFLCGAVTLVARMVRHS